MLGEVVRRSYLHFRPNPRPRETIPTNLLRFLSFYALVLLASGDTERSSIFRFPFPFPRPCLMSGLPHPLPADCPREKGKKERRKKIRGKRRRTLRLHRTRCTSALPSSRLRLTQFIALRPAARLLALLLSRCLHALRF